MEFSRRFLLSALSLAAATPAMAKASHINDLQATIDKAVEADGILTLPAGNYEASNIRVTGPLRLTGAGARTRLIAVAGQPALSIAGASDVFLEGITFASEGRDDVSLVSAIDAKFLTIDNCAFEGGGRGLALERSSGAIRHSRFRQHSVAAIYTIDSRGLEISGNTIADIGTNGIMVWTSEKSEDGTLVTGNRISKVSSLPGDTGQTGNGVSIFRAGNVVVSANRISDCAYSAIRNNGGSNCQIIGNSASRLGETALYCEFEFQGAVIANNIVDTAGNGISITNFDVGGRLATCTGNVIRRCKGFGIFVEAQTTITGNAVEEAIETGIGLGWSFAAKSLIAANNIVAGCGRGITFSVAEGAEPPMIVNNRITTSRHQAIAAMDHTNLASGDLALPDAVMPQGAVITGNVTS